MIRSFRSIIHIDLFRTGIRHDHAISRLDFALSNYYRIIQIVRVCGWNNVLLIS